MQYLEFIGIINFLRMCSAKSPFVLKLVLQRGLGMYNVACKIIRYEYKVRTSFILWMMFCTKTASAQALNFQTKLQDLLIPVNADITNLIATIIFLGSTGFALLAAFSLIRERTRTAKENRELKIQLADIMASREQFSSLVNVEDQRIILWQNASSSPLILGDLPAATGVPNERSMFLGFGAWLMASSAVELERAIDRLRRNAEGFDLNLQSNVGAYIEAQGRTSGGSAFVRFLDLTGERAVLASLEQEHHTLFGTLETLQSLLQNMKNPAWLRDKNGRFTWVNQAYLSAVGTDTVESVVTRSTELMESSDVVRARDLLQTENYFSERVSAIVDSDRKYLDLTEIRTEHGFAGLAFDVSEVEEVSLALKRLEKSHAQTLDYMDSAIAIYDTQGRLAFYNSSFQKLWNLQVGFLDSHPDHGEILEKLRSDRKISETPDWKKWKQDFLAVHQGMDAVEDLLHLPDGRTLHIVATPQRSGGVTWIFTNVTDQLELEGRFDVLTKVQSESFENLVEGVAVFGSDGKLQLSNSAFGSMWSLEEEERAAGIHVAQLAEICAERASDSQHWANFVSAITGVTENRSGIHNRMNLVNNRSYDFAIVPLPDGQTMLTFVDVTDSVQVENALTQRNEALQAAETLKNAFVANMSYELRTLLNNIKGYTDMLLMGTFGDLNTKQSEYMGDVQNSTAQLETIVDSMLDLASIDAGLIELNIAEIKLMPILDEVRMLLAKQIDTRGIILKTEIAENAEIINADSHRLQQILTNLISNAVKFSPPDGVVHISSIYKNGLIEISVQDEGPGIPDDFVENAFQRFEGRNLPGARKGAGLGLALVQSLMHLHEGKVWIENEDQGKGAKVICQFPIPQATQ